MKRDPHPTLYCHGGHSFSVQCSRCGEVCRWRGYDATEADDIATSHGWKTLKALHGHDFIITTRCPACIKEESAS